MKKDLEKEFHICNRQNLSDQTYLQIGHGIGREVLVIGESPAGKGWFSTGRPFHDHLGRLLPTAKNPEEYLMQIDNKLSIENISFLELSKCYLAGNRRKLKSCSEKVWELTRAQIFRVNPKLIIILGKQTLRVFNDLAETEARLGQLSNCKIGNISYDLLPIYHPSPANPRRSQNSEFIVKNLYDIRSILLNN